MAEYSLVVPLLNDDPAYAHGVEFGLLYARLRRRPRAFRDYVLRDNQDQILLLAGRLGYEVVRMRPWKKGWLWLHLRRTSP